MTHLPPHAFRPPATQPICVIRLDRRLSD
jgi:hypothetical protein